MLNPLKSAGSEDANADDSIIQEEVLQTNSGNIQDNCLLRKPLDAIQDSELGPASCSTEKVKHSEVSMHADHFKKKLPGLVKLTVPSTPEHSTDTVKESWTGVNDLNESDDSIEMDSPTAEPLLDRRPFPTYARMKTRLQDPPPLTPAVKSQLTYCRSTLTRQKTFTVSNAEQHTPKVDTGPVGTLQSTDPSLANASLGHMSSSSKLKVLANGEEEKNVLGDEDYIAENKSEENKWLLITQWCSLLVLVALLVCTNKIRKLEKVTFLGLNLWRWQALTLVIFCGHLISGWIMKVSLLAPGVFVSNQ